MSVGTLHSDRSSILAVFASAFPHPPTLHLANRQIRVQAVHTGQ